jgi:cell division protein FtsW
VQLPLISAGGTSAVITLATLGLLANCARHEPETVSSMQHEGRPWFDRVLLLREPAPYTSGAEQRDRVRPQARRYGEPVTRRSGPRSGDFVDRRDARHRSARAGYRDTPERDDRTRSREQRQYRTDEPRRRHRPCMIHPSPPDPCPLFSQVEGRPDTSSRHSPSPRHCARHSPVSG